MKRDAIAFLVAVVLPLTAAYIFLHFKTRKNCGSCAHSMANNEHDVNIGCWRHGSHGEAVTVNRNECCPDWLKKKDMRPPDNPPHVCNTCADKHCIGRMWPYGGNSRCDRWIDENDRGMRDMIERHF